MHITTDLEKLQTAALRRLDQTRARLIACPIPPDPTAERVIALCVIEAQATWSLFVRYFFLSCALGARRVGGGRVSSTLSGLRTEQDAVAFAVATTRPRAVMKKRPGPLDEPPWHKDLTLRTLALAAGLSNQPQIAAALAVQGRGIEDLPRARNFYAHRSRRTAVGLRDLARHYGLPAPARVGAFPGIGHPERPCSIAAAWVGELRAVVNLLPR